MALTQLEARASAQQGGVSLGSDWTVPPILVLPAPWALFPLKTLMSVPPALAVLPAHQLPVPAQPVTLTSVTTVLLRPVLPVFQALLQLEALPPVLFKLPTPRSSLTETPTQSTVQRPSFWAFWFPFCC